MEIFQNDDGSKRRKSIVSSLSPFSLKGEVTSPPLPTYMTKWLSERIRFPVFHSFDVEYMFHISCPCMVREYFWSWREELAPIPSSFFLHLIFSFQVNINFRCFFYFLPKPQTKSKTCKKYLHTYRTEVTKLQTYLLDPFSLHDRWRYSIRRNFRNNVGLSSLKNEFVFKISSFASRILCSYTLAKAAITWCVLAKFMLSWFETWKGGGKGLPFCLCYFF